MLIGDKYQVRTIPDNIVLEEKVKGTGSPGLLLQSAQPA